jgi:hypothetical protein
LQERDLLSKGDEVPKKDARGKGAERCGGKKGPFLSKRNQAARDQDRIRRKRRRRRITGARLVFDGAIKYSKDDRK